MTTMELPSQASSDSQTPFDDIKQTRPDGSEFWSARDLLLLMGYTQWKNFEVPLARAMKSAFNQEIDLTSNFSEMRKVSNAGPSQKDYHLSRFAAYLVTMNGDPNKAEVAAAQGYFAKQTRFAELVQENPALLAPATEAPRALSAREVGTFYANTLSAYTATVTIATVDTPAAHALTYSMQEFVRLMTRMVKDAASTPSLDGGDTDSVEGAPVFSIDGPGSLSPYVDRSSGAASEGSRLPDFTFLHADETHELITWATFAKSKGLPRCGRCAQGLSRRIMCAATSCGTSRGRVSGHNVFSLPAWELAWELHENRYTTMHSDPARNHNGGNA